MLDEATSALDEKTELPSLKSIREEVADLTLIKVAINKYAWRFRLQIFAAAR